VSWLERQDRPVALSVVALILVVGVGLALFFISPSYIFEGLSQD
jgi:hypothetical protein